MIASAWSRPARVVSVLKRLLALWLLLFGLSCRAAVASDVLISYAVEAKGETDSGNLNDCEKVGVCRFHAAGLDVEIVLYSEAGVAMLEMIVKGPPDCCYTFEAKEQFRATIKPGLTRLEIYQRMWSPHDDFVRTPFSWNGRIGTVYLAFSQKRLAK